MSIENQTDLDGLTAVGRIVALTIAAVAARLRPGVTTGELDRFAEDFLGSHGARPAPRLVYGFPGAIMLSINDEAVHGVPGARAIAAGDLVKIDVTAELAGYVADAAETVAVPPVSALDHNLIACRTMDGSRVAHHEHTLVITRGRPILLTRL